MKIPELRLPHLDRQHMVNALTFSRGLLALTGLTMFTLDNPVLGTACFIAAIGTDIDGRLARHWKVVSERGARLDAFTDGITFIAATASLAAIYHSHSPEVLIILALLGFATFDSAKSKVRLTRLYLQSQK